MKFWFRIKNLDYIENLSDFNIKELNNDSIDKKDIKNLTSILIFEYFSTPDYTIIEKINKFKKFLESNNKIEIHFEIEYEENKKYIKNFIKVIIPNPNFNIDILKGDLSKLREINFKATSQCLHSSLQFRHFILSTSRTKSQ